MGIKIITKNRRASYDYSLIEKVEAGLVLKGTEVKGIRHGNMSLKEAHVQVTDKMEAFIYNLKIPSYEFGNRFNHEENRKKKLLLHRKQIENLYHQAKAQGLSIIPTMLYFKDSRVKIEIALGKGKKLYDKRHDQAKKDAEKKLRKGDYT